MKPIFTQRAADVLLAITIGVAMAAALVHWSTCEGMC